MIQITRKTDTGLSTGLQTITTMTENSASTVCKYTAQLETENGRYVIAVPDAEVEYGPLALDGAYRITIEHVDAPSQDTTATTAPSATGPQTSDVQAPVSEDDQLDVEIEDLGQQGDGIARVGPGYVLIVPGSDVGDTVTVEVQEVNPSFGFAEIVAYHDVDESTDDESSDTTSEAASHATEDEESTATEDDTAEAPVASEDN